MLLTLISDRLRSRLEGSLIDIDQLEMDREIGKGSHNLASAIYICVRDNWYSDCVSWALPYNNWEQLSLWDFNDEIIKWKHFPRYWPFVRGIHQSRVTSPHKGQWRGALLFSLIRAWINSWGNNREAADSRRHCAHYGVILMGKLGDITV